MWMVPDVTFSKYCFASPDGRRLRARHLGAQWLSGDGGSETFEFSVRISIFVLSIGRAGESGSGTLNSHFSVRISIFALSILWFFQAYRVDSSIHLFTSHHKIIKKVVYEYHQTFQRIVIFSGCSKRCISAPQLPALSHLTAGR